MKIRFLFFLFTGLSIIDIHNGYAQSAPYVQTDPVTMQILKQSMPYTVTIDGKRIYSVESNHICSITVTMSSNNKYHFSLLHWPQKSYIDDMGYSTFTLQDTDNKPHILRTDKIKGKKFLESMKTLITHCQTAEKSKVTKPL